MILTNQKLILIMLSVLGVFHLTPPALPIIHDQSNLEIAIYPERNKLIVREHGQVIKTYPVAVGNPSTPEPRVYPNA